MHWPAEDGTPIDAYWQTLLDLKQQGKVAAVGLSNHNAGQLAVAEAIGHVDTLQPPFLPPPGGRHPSCPGASPTARA